MNKFIVTTVFLLVSTSVLSGQEEYDDCILQHLKEVKLDIVTHHIKQACYDNYKSPSFTNDKKKAYDIAQGLRDNDGNYLVYSLTELSQYSGFAAMPKKEFCGIVSGLIEAGKIVNTLKTLYKEIKAAERASKNAGKTGKNTPAKKAADTRHKNNMQAAMDELTDGFLV